MGWQQGPSRVLSPSQVLEVVCNPRSQNTEMDWEWVPSQGWEPSQHSAMGTEWESEPSQDSGMGMG